MKKDNSKTSKTEQKHQDMVSIVVNGETVQIPKSIKTAASKKYQRQLFDASDDVVAVDARRMEIEEKSSKHVHAVAVASTLARLKVAGEDAIIDARIENKYKGLLREGSFLVSRPDMQGVQGDLAAMRGKAVEMPAPTLDEAKAAILKIDNSGN